MPFAGPFVGFAWAHWNGLARYPWEPAIGQFYQWRNDYDENPRTPNGATLTLDEAHVKTGIPDLFATRDPANGKWMLLRRTTWKCLRDIVDAYYPQWKAQQAANQPKAVIRHLEQNIAEMANDWLWAFEPPVI